MNSGPGLLVDESVEGGEYSVPQLDALRELGNIGAGNAATSLAEFTGRAIDLAIPDVRLVGLAEVGSLLGPPETPVVAIFLGVEGDLDGQMLLVMDTADCMRLGGALLGDPDPTQDLAISVVSELGNILTAAYLSAIEVLTGLTAQPTVPSVAVDMAGALITAVVLQRQEMDDEALVIDARFLEEDATLSGHFLFLPGAGALQRLLSALGM